MPLPIDEQYILNNLIDMVKIDSVNSDLVPGAKGEGQMAEYIAYALNQMGVEVEVDPIDGDRANVTGILRGTGGGKSLMLNGHTDTVGVEGLDEPFSGRVEDGRVYGRGAFDMKASLAASLGVMKALVDSGTRLQGDLLFTAVIDEEYASLGTEAIVKKYKTDGAIVTEPTGLRVCRGHRGFLWIEIITTGRAAHGSHFEEGIDANMMMGRVLVELDKLAHDLVSREGHPLLGPPSLHAPLIQGGSSQSVYAATCRMELERRLLPGDTNEIVMAEIQAVLDRLAAADEHFQATARPFFRREAYEAAEDAPIVQTTLNAAQSVTGQTPDIYGEVWWMDSALLAAAGIETVIIGPTGDGAHADVEWVDIQSVNTLAHILAQAAQDYCGTA